MREYQLSRQTTETQIDLKICLDGSGQHDIKTGLPFFDHMLQLFAAHGKFDLTLKAEGDIEIDPHHTVEDTGIVLGQCIKSALGEKKGITRYGHAYVPMDEALTRTVIDLSGRSYLSLTLPSIQDHVQNFPTQLLEEFLRALSTNAEMNLHVENFYGRDAHHIAESIFKSLARSLRIACSIDPQGSQEIPSTKGVL